MNRAGFLGRILAALGVGMTGLRNAQAQEVAPPQSSPPAPPCPRCKGEGEVWVSDFHAVATTMRLEAGYLPAPGSAYTLYPCPECSAPKPLTYVRHIGDGFEVSEELRRMQGPVLGNWPVNVRWDT